MMRVLFIQRGPFISLGILSLSSVLKKHGHTVDVIVTAMEKDWLRAAGEFGPEVVGLPCMTGEHTFMLSVADRIKEQYPWVLVVLGGPHPTFCPDIIERPSIDFIIRGEAEHAMADLLERLERREELSTVQNLGRKAENGSTILNPLRPLEQTLDTFPWPDRHLYDKYGGLQQKTTYWTVAGRGCSYNCSFCPNTALKAMYREEDADGRYVRKRSPQNVIEELRAAKVQWGVRNIVFQDDTFTTHHARFLSPFLKKYRTEIALPFSCQTRPELVTDEIASRLKAAGCYGVRIGLETADEEINNTILAKGVMLKQIIESAETIHRYGLRLQTLSMLGSPGESLETALETLRLNQQIKPDFARASLTLPYPRTPLMEHCIRQNLLVEGFHVDKFEDSFFIDTPIQFQDKREVLRLQKVFGICVKWPFVTPLMKRLIRMKGGERLLDLLFRLDYAHSCYRFYDFEPLEFLKTLISARDSYLTTKNQPAVPRGGTRGTRRAPASG